MNKKQRKKAMNQKILIDQFQHAAHTAVILQLTFIDAPFS